MRNELSLSNEVALEGPAWHSCCFEEEVLLQNCQQALMDEREGVVSGQRIFTLLICSEGDDTQWLLQKERQHRVRDIHNRRNCVYALDRFTPISHYSEESRARYSC